MFGSHVFSHNFNSQPRKAIILCIHKAITVWCVRYKAECGVNMKPCDYSEAIHHIVLGGDNKTKRVKVIASIRQYVMFIK